MTTETITLSSFLLARIAEDEDAARAASPGGWQFATVESVGGGSLYDETRMIGALHYEQPDEHDGTIVRHLLSAEANRNGAHIARHDPARVLAECASKRAIVELHAAYPTLQVMVYGTITACSECGSVDDSPVEWPCPTLRTLGAVYADAPQFREEWRP